MNRRNLVFESIVYAPYTFRDRKILRLDRLLTLRTVKISVPVKFRLPAARSAIRTEKILFFPTFFKTFHFPVYLAFVIGAHLPGNCSTFPRTNETRRILLRLSFLSVLRRLRYLRIFVAPDCSVTVSSVTSVLARARVLHASNIERRDTR